MKIQFLTKMKAPGIYTKVMLVIILMILMMIAGVSLATSHYYTDYSMKLQQNYNSQVIHDVSGDIDRMYSSVQELYYTFNSQKPFDRTTCQGNSAFEIVNKQISFEHSVLDVINANNLQSLIVGILFYLDEDTYGYVGSNTPSKDFNFSESEWFQLYLAGSRKKLIYGPLTEDFKPKNTERSSCMYYIGRYGFFSSNSFLLFELSLDQLLTPIEGFIREDRRIVIENRDGDLVYQSGFSEEEKESLLPLVLKKTGSTSNPDSFNIQNYYVCTYSLDTLGWTISFLDLSKNVLQNYYTLQGKVILIIAAFSLICLFGSILVIRHIMMPLQTLNHYIDIMEDQPDAMIQVTSDYEIQKVQKRLNDMKRKIMQMNDTIYQASLQEKEAEVRALQAQINPHFFYNTLDNIYCIAQLGETEPLLILIEKLSLMMRYNMDMKKKFVPLSMELEHIKNYITILNIRFDDRIILDNRIDESFYNCSVLKLSLQPLVENAWKHGLLLEELPKGHIILRAEIRLEEEYHQGDLDDNRVLYLQVENDGRSIPKEQLELINDSLKKGCGTAVETASSSSPENTVRHHGIGLYNINNRIRLSFGPQYGLSLENCSPGGCRVTIRIPLLFDK